MPDMSAEFHRCCGYTVEISGYPVTLSAGGTGRRIYCELCGEAFEVPGEIEDARQAVPAHFLTKHRLNGQLDDWHP
jgi:hypothetical protein